MQHLILAGCVMISALLSITAADDLNTGAAEPSDEMPAISDTDTFSATIRGASSEKLTDMAEDRDPSNMASSSNVAWSSNVAPSSKVASVEEPHPTAPSISEDSAGTSSNAIGVIRANPDDSEAGYSQRDVVIIAVCVSLLSLIVVILSVAMTFLIRRRMRQKAYLRVKHASQTELSVHYIQNTPASAAARDLVIEQLFESLASMDGDGQNDFQIAYSSDDQYLSPSESIGSELVGGKNKMYSRSMPSLKNLNAHEEALNCNFSFVPSDVTVGKRKGRSRSFTEKTVSGVGIEATRGKNPLRSHSEKAKNRLAVVSLLTPGKRFEKKKDKSNRRSTPSFSRFAKFNILRGQPSKQKATNARDQQTIANDQTIAAELTPLTQITSESDANVVIAVDNGDLARAKCYSTSLSDFELPNVSPIMHEMKPMLAALQMNGNALHNCEPTAEDITVENNDINIFRDVPLSNRLSIGTDKAASLEQVVGEYFCKKSRATPAAGKISLPTRQTKPSHTSRSVNDLDAMRTTVV